MTLRSIPDSLILKMHNAKEYCNAMQKAYKQQYDEELLVYNLRKKSVKPMPNKVRFALIFICIFGLALWYWWWFA